jgi:ABC-type uncharacterized transport system ATPase component
MNATVKDVMSTHRMMDALTVGSLIIVTGSPAGPSSRSS